MAETDTAAARTEIEGQVLSTLFLRPESWKEIPEDFFGDDFESHEFRELFQLLLSEYRASREGFDPWKSISEKRFQSVAPLAVQITKEWPILNGSFLEIVRSLSNHRIPFDLSHKQDGEFHFQLHTGTDISSMNLPPHEFLIDGSLSRYGVSTFAGEPGAGKSLLMMNMAISIAIGAREFLGNKINFPGKVLYLNNELHPVDFFRRVKTMLERLPVQGDVSNFIVPETTPTLKECWPELNRLCESTPFVAMVIDCVYMAHDEDENDASDIRAFMKKCIELRDKFSLSLILVHHTRKGTQGKKIHDDQLRGSSIFSAASDTVFQLRRSDEDESKRLLKVTKGRNLPDSARGCRLLSLDDHLWFHDGGAVSESDHIFSEPAASEEIDFKAIFEKENSLTRKEIVSRCAPYGYSDRTIDRILNRSKAKGLLKVERYGFYDIVR